MSRSREDTEELENLLRTALSAVDHDPSLAKDKIRVALELLSGNTKEPEESEDESEDDMPGLEESGAPPAAAAAAEEKEEEEEEEEVPDEGLVTPDTEPFPANGEGVEPTDDAREAAMPHKMAASEAKAKGDWAAAVESLTEAIKLSPSLLAYTNRAFALLALSPPRPNAAVADCSRALSTNPDSAKSLKARGKAYRMLGMYEEAANDLCKGCALDFDAESGELKKFVEARIAKLELKRAEERIQRSRRASQEKVEAAEAVKRKREAAKRDYEQAVSSSGGGMGGGMGSGMGGSKCRRP